MTIHIAPVGVSIITNFANIENREFTKEPVGSDSDGQEFPWTSLIKQVKDDGLLEFGFQGKSSVQVLDAAFGPNAAADSPERKRIQEIANNLHSGEWISYLGVSAELDTIRHAAMEISSAKRKEEFLPGKNDAVFLIATDTNKGIAAALWNAIALAGGDIKRIRYFPTLEEDTFLDKSVIGCVNIIRFPGLDAVNSDQAFREPMKLMGRLGRLIIAPSRSMRGKKLKRLIAKDDEEIRFYLSGGYKATIPYLIALAEWVRGLDENASAWIKHEKSIKAFRLPLRRFDGSKVRHELKVFQNGSKVKYEYLDENHLEGYAYEVKEGVAELTAFGQGMCELFGIPTESVPQ